METLKYLLSPVKSQMIISLSLIAVSVLLFTRNWNYAFIILLATVVAFVTDSILIRLRHIEPFRLNAAVVSGLIIALLSSPTIPWYFVAGAAVLAMASKNFIRFKNRHIFNPAGFGLFFSSILFHANISWWGVSWQILHINITYILLFLIFISPGFISMIELRRFRIALSFWVTYILLLIIFHMDLTFDPSVLFFSFVMLPEPMTTPNSSKKQLLFGPFVALISIITGSFITGLLAGNFVFFVSNYVL